MDGLPSVHGDPVRRQPFAERSRSALTRHRGFPGLRLRSANANLTPLSQWNPRPGYSLLAVMACERGRASRAPNLINPLNPIPSRESSAAAPTVNGSAAGREW